MLRYILLGIVFVSTVSSSIAFATDDESQIECANGPHRLRVTHVEDQSESVGKYRIDTLDFNRATTSVEVVSIDYFGLLDKLWQSGEIQFSNVSGKTVFSIFGSPFVKRDGTYDAASFRPLGSLGSEQMRCEVKAALPLVSCHTNAAADSSQFVVQFRHATDLGTSTGYYIARVFKIFGSGSLDFGTKIIGSFSLNRRLVTGSFEGGKSIEFQLHTGEKIVLDNWVSSADFGGKTNIGGEIVPVTCALQAGI